MAAFRLTGTIGDETAALSAHSDGQGLGPDQRLICGNKKRPVEKADVVGGATRFAFEPVSDELLLLDHPARFVAEFVDALGREGWAETGVGVEGHHPGAPTCHPRALLSVWLYGFMTSVRSCHKPDAACRDQIPCLWLTGCQHPVAVIPAPSAGHEGAVQAHCKVRTAPPPS